MVPIKKNSVLNAGTDRVLAAIYLATVVVGLTSTLWEVSKSVKKITGRPVHLFSVSLEVVHQNEGGEGALVVT